MELFPISQGDLSSLLFPFLLNTSLACLLGAFFYISPGWAILQLLFPGKPTWSWPAKLGLAAGISLSIYPLLFLWSDVFNLHPGRLIAWIPPLLATAYLLVSGIVRRRQMHLSLPTWKPSAPQLLFLFSFGLLIASRFWAIHHLSAPLWGDSVHHSVMAQLFYEHGGMFSSWQPYAPYTTLTVQFGFSAIAAVWMWGTSSSSLEAVLITGQLVNIFAVLALIPLAEKAFHRDDRLSSSVVLVAGLLSWLPGGYVNWGRYAQLAGQVILPTSMVFLWQLYHQEVTPLSRRSFPWAVVALTSVVICSMTLTYYRMPLFLAAFAVPLTVLWVARYIKHHARRGLPVFISLLIAGIFALVLFLPWYQNVSGGALSSQVESGIKDNLRPIELVIADYQIWKNITEYFPPYLLVAFVAASIWSVFRKTWNICLLSTWAVFLALLVASQLLRIPTANFMQNFATIIALYMPLSIVVGWALVDSFTILQQKITCWNLQRSKFSHINTVSILGWMIASLYALSAVLGAVHQARISDPDFYAFVTPQDLQGMAWIRQNIPEKALFLVEGFPVETGDSLVGGDAGWWLPLLTGKSNTIPPQYAMLNESPEEKDYNQRMVDLVVVLESNPITSPAALQKLCSENISHIYIGQKLGRVSYGGQPLFTKEVMLESKHFNLLYQLQNVAIFQFLPSACSQP